VTFTHAYSTAPSTKASVAALFAGRYAGQIKWTRKKLRKKSLLWPDDPSPRIGDLLAKRDVESVVITGKLNHLKPQHGVTAGQRIELRVPANYSHLVVPTWLQWLASHRRGGVFAYLHVFDPHSPYTLGGTSGSAHERYAREIAVVDRSLGTLLDGLRALELEDRVIIVLTADHGEAFGEHNSQHHASTVYEEMVRVPLVIAGKNLKSRVVDQAVTLLDVAPTVLDLFGAPTPGSFMGQSLVPLLAGEDLKLTRPIFLESHRGYAGMVFDDGVKLVLRGGVPELYDLRIDPGELVNTYDSRADAAERLGAFKSFVAAHRMKFPTDYVNK
jgi:arylsulfatase A-like enzyme